MAGQGRTTTTSSWRYCTKWRDPRSLKSVSQTDGCFVDRAGLDHVGAFGGDLFRSLFARAHDGDVAGPIRGDYGSLPPRAARGWQRLALDWHRRASPSRAPRLLRRAIRSAHSPAIFGRAPAGAKCRRRDSWQRRRRRRCNEYVCQATFPARRSASRYPNKHLLSTPMPSSTFIMACACGVMVSAGCVAPAKTTRTTKTQIAMAARNEAVIVQNPFAHSLADELTMRVALAQPTS